MDTRYRLVGLSLMLILSLALTATPAAAYALAAPGAPRNLPPLPEWPIIGPILRMLGVTDTAESAAAPVPDPALPEIRIRTLDDLETLQQVEPNERFRVIAADDDLNRIAQEILRERAEDNLSFAVNFDANLVTVEGSVDAALLERTGLDLPGFVRGRLNVEGTARAAAEACQPTLAVRSVKVNGWGIGLRAMAQRVIDTQLPNTWPAEICVERVLLMDGEAAIEGYRVP